MLKIISHIIIVGTRYENSLILTKGGEGFLSVYELVEFLLDLKWF